MRIIYRTAALLAALLAPCTETALGQALWTKYQGNPVVAAPGPWYQGAISPCVLYNQDSSRFEMWFSGSAGAGGQRPFQIGYAVSNDGVSWTVRTTPVLSPSPDTSRWDSYTVEAPYVIRQNGSYKMWYTGSRDFVSFAVGYATSADGITWTKHLSNPVFRAGTSTWELAGPGYCCVLPSGGGYKMWYTSLQAMGSREYIGYAESSDGLQWRRDTLHNPILGPGASGQWDQFMVALPRVMYAGNRYSMWYLGSNVLFSGLRGGLATSGDGVTNWVKHQDNPVLRPSPSGWDRNDVEIGSVISVRDSLYLYYDGIGTRWQIGLAKGRFATSVADLPGTAPTDFHLMQNYPNPFNPVTTIGYQLPRSSHVSLVVYDLLGREVAVLVDGVEEAGHRSVTFDASSLASGVYLYRLRAGEFTQTRKLAVVR